MRRCIFHSRILWIAMLITGFAFGATSFQSPDSTEIHGATPPLAISDATAPRMFFVVLSKRPTDFDEQRRRAYLKFYFGTSANNDRTLTAEQMDKVLSMVDSVASDLATFHQQFLTSRPEQPTGTRAGLIQAINNKLNAALSLAASDPDAAAKVNRHVVDTVKNHIHTNVNATTSNDTSTAK
jgi:hypothetical protein